MSISEINLLKNKIEIELSDGSRFHTIDGFRKRWFYDSYMHILFSMTWEENEGNHDAEIKLIKRILEQKDEVAPFVAKKKCVVMINTSNRCNLSCSYCFRGRNKSSLADIETVKKSLDFVFHRYRPNADEYVISYSMTSESSVDLGLLKHIAEEYIKYEDYRFCLQDMNFEFLEEFCVKLSEDFSDVPKNLSAQDNGASLVVFLNSLLEKRNLYDILHLSPENFSMADNREIGRRDFISKWRLFRLNRWCLESVYAKFVKRRKNPYIGFWFMTNGTCANRNFIDFVKACVINPLLVSIDGPESVHNYNRKYSDGNASYSDIVKNLEVFLRNGIILNASAVITDFFPKPLEIVRHLVSLNFSAVTMIPVRPGYGCSFNENNVSILLHGYDELYSEFKTGALKGDFSLFRILRSDLSLAAFNIFLDRTKLLKRCDFDEQIVIDCDGSVYPCVYFVGHPEFCWGNVGEGIAKFGTADGILVNQRGECASCWARYLCGGTCFYGAQVTSGYFRNTEPVECLLKRHLAEKCLELLIFLTEKNVDLSKIYQE